MIIHIKNKDTLIIEGFEFKCSVGKRGIRKNKFEGDFYTPSGKFEIGKLYWRPDRVKLPKTKLVCKKIKKSMGWCNDIDSQFYNKEIKINKKIKHEKLKRKDDKYNLLIPIKYNFNNPILGLGSCIFIHLTKNYQPTNGCIALKKKDFLIMLKLIKKNTKIKIS